MGYLKKKSLYNLYYIFTVTLCSGTAIRLRLLIAFCFSFLVFSVFFSFDVRVRLMYYSCKSILSSALSYCFPSFNPKLGISFLFYTFSGIHFSQRYFFFFQHRSNLIYFCFIIIKKKKNAFVLFLLLFYISKPLLHYLLLLNILIIFS